MARFALSGEGGNVFIEYEVGKLITYYKINLFYARAVHGKYYLQSHRCIHKCVVSNKVILVTGLAIQFRNNTKQYYDKCSTICQTASNLGHVRFPLFFRKFY
jgi:hypothetical protein